MASMSNASFLSSFSSCCVAFLIWNVTGGFMSVSMLFSFALLYSLFCACACVGDSGIIPPSYQISYMISSAFFHLEL
ncbi:hypothetical protein BDW71DRAFT_148542 [Aspergillus fruticulosus]